MPYLLSLAAPQKKISYSADVAPVLKARCASCHSGKDPSGDLDVTSPTALKTVVQPGKGAGSTLIHRLKGDDGQPRMPLGFVPLSDEQIATISKWIDEGAVFDGPVSKHWSFIPPRRPPVPKLNSKWVINPVDAFVLQRLRNESIAPAPAAKRETLVRRVYLDLLGLPPSPAEVDAFVRDTRPDAYERLVDRLLTNPHYGERMAMPWLDLSRYADTDGYEKDLSRTAWKYRDWVISAFNRNLPYDQFTIEQLAGDLLPNPTLDQLIATGFNRNTQFNREGGVDQEEAHFNVILDRVNTTSTVWLGSTLQCARCHDHKYDPLSQKDYYRMAAFFANSQIYPRGPKQVGEEKWFEAEMEAPTRAQVERRSNLKSKIALLSRHLEWRPALQSAFTTWQGQIRTGLKWTPVVPKAATSSGGALLSIAVDGTVLASGTVAATDDYDLLLNLPQDAQGIRIEVLPDDSLPGHGPGRAPNGNFVLSSVYGVHKPAMPNCGVGVKHVPRRAAADYAQKEFFADRILGKDREFGWGIDGGQGKPHEIVIDLGIPAKSDYRLHLQQLWPGGRHLLGKFRISVTSTENPASLYLPPALANADEAKLRDYFLKVTPLLDQPRQEMADARARLQALEAAIPTALVMRDKPGDGPLTAFVHTRGEFLGPAEPVSAGFPAVLAPESAGDEALKLEANAGTDSGEPAPVPHINANGQLTGARKTRLDLAKWLVSRGNPLAARVEVNRLWEQVFGRGLVETSEDFGTQGSPPSHAELLDWLACEFMDSGWNVKHLMKLIVTSATYRQSSAASTKTIARDPQNVLLARGPRFRMDAELIRDNALAASGLLTQKVGGPSVYPYQPEGVWDNPFSNERWPESKNGDQYRRGMYTFLKRTSPYPSFLNFDSSSRESCVVRRIRTNTPLQALALLNDRALFDAAQALGRRMLAEGGPNLATRLAYGFRLCTGRKPSLQELDRLGKLFATVERRYAKDKSAYAKLPRAPYTIVANVLLNLDETITKS